jgi:hypothetical protein
VADANSGPSRYIVSRSRLNPRIGEKPFIKSRPLDVHRWADYPQLNNCLDELVACIEAREPERKKRSKSETKKLRDLLTDHRA